MVILSMYFDEITLDYNLWQFSDYHYFVDLTTNKYLY